MAKILLEILPVFVIMLCYGLGGVELLSVKTFDPLGASSYPLFLAATSLILIVCAAFRQKSGKRSINWDEAKAPLVRIILISAETVIYLLLLDLAGFVLLTPFYIGAMLVTMGYKRHIMMVLISIAITAILYAMFGMMFRVLLPMGPLSNWIF